MAWITVRYRLTSSCPLIMHNGQLADPRNKFAKAIKQITSKRSKTDADYDEISHLEFLGGLYMGVHGPILPADVIEGMIKSAARKSREGRSAEAGCYCAEHSNLDYQGPREAEELWKIEQLRFVKIVRVKSARVMRTRPIFHDWGATITLNVEPSIVNVRRMDDWMEIGGTQAGLCNWRPRYGRFTAERLNEE